MKFRNKNISAQLMLCLAMAAGSGSAMAADTTINITGNVVATPCSIATTKAVVIPDVNASVLTTAGTASPFTNFTLEITNCPATTTGADLTFGGTASHVDYYQNTGTAQNVDVELTSDYGQKNMGVGKVFAVAINATTHSSNVDLKTRIRNGGDGAAMPGTVVAAVLVSIAYK